MIISNYNGKYHESSRDSQNVAKQAHDLANQNPLPSYQFNGICNGLHGDCFGQAVRDPFASLRRVNAFARFLHRHFICVDMKWRSS